MEGITYMDAAPATRASEDFAFDRELAGRLTAYESRLPDAQPPAADEPVRGGGPRWPLVGIGALAAVAAVLAVAVMLGGFRDDTGEASPSPRPSVSARPSDPAPSPTAGSVESDGPTPTAEPPSTPPGATAGLRWSETASFGSRDAPTTVSAVVLSDAGLVAVGVAYEYPLPIFGPTPPLEGRVWLSTDGMAWEDVTPDSLFVNAELRHLLVTSDRRLIAHGWVYVDDLGERRPAAWESIDGRQWGEVDHGFPDGRPMSMAQGARGNVALVFGSGTPSQTVWWSADGRTWELVHELDDQGGYWVGAGDEGFVVAGWETDAQVPVAFASGDGRAWFEAGTPPPGVAAGIAPRGGDWTAVSREPEFVIGEASTAEVWSSANGLEWDRLGAFGLESRTAGDAPCTEWPTSLHAAGPWLIAGTIVSYPCSEGGVETQGAQRISRDGVEWSELPFAPASEEIGLGTRIAGAVEVDNRLILVGEHDGAATFWIGERL